MKERDLISVVVPVYNIAGYVENCVRSVMKQSYADLEIILVDDGSTDDSGTILDRLATEDSRITVLHQKNKGVTCARLAGVRASHGGWVGFVDGDDEIEPDMYERLLTNAVNRNADISHCGYKMVFPDRTDYYYDTGKRMVQDNRQGLKDLISGSFVEPGLWNKLFSRKLFRKMLQNDVMDTSVRNYEDLLMNFYLFQESRTAVYEDFCPYHYLIREGSAATAEANEHNLGDPLVVLKAIKRGTKEDPVLQKAVNKRIADVLIRLATMRGAAKEKRFRRCRRRAHKELKEMLPELIKNDYPLRTKILSLWAVYSPLSYAGVHSAYSFLTGTDKKYSL